MNLERLGRGNKVSVAVGVLVVLAVAGGAYLVFEEQEPVKISNAEELQQVRENPSGNYVLVDDIDLSHIDNFEPIENFTGTFDGNGHTISNLTIDRPEMDSVGLFRTVDDNMKLFGLVGDKGTVRSVRLKSVNVTGSNAVGALTGSNRGTVTKSGVEGDVTGDWGVGGLVGVNEGSVHQSYASGDVSSDDHNSIGGLVGYNYGEIIDSYSESDVSGAGAVGGLVGVNQPIPRTEGTVVRSYATGEVSGEGTGGLVAQTVRGEITDSYWDINATGQNESAGGVGLTTDKMTGSAARENMEGFDFEDTWRTTEEYPRLVWQEAEDNNPCPDEPREDTSTNQTQAQSEDSTSTDLVSFSGLIFKNRTVRSLQWFYLENRTDTTNPDGDDFTMQGIDADGNVISSQSFDAPFEALVSPTNESPIDTNVTGFALKEEYPLDLAKFRLVENGTTIAEFNPNIELLRTTVRSIPRSGFKQQEIAEQRRKTLRNEIDELESLLEDGNTQAAVRKMENDIKPSLDRWLKDGYETKSALQMKKEEVMTTAEAVTERLRAQQPDGGGTDR